MCYLLHEVICNCSADMINNVVNSLKPTPTSFGETYAGAMTIKEVKPTIEQLYILT